MALIIKFVRVTIVCLKFLHLQVSGTNLKGTCTVTSTAYSCGARRRLLTSEIFLLCCWLIAVLSRSCCSL